jgi:hypothetical protein
MPSLLESFTQSFAPNVLGQLGKAAGLDGATTTKGLEVIGPLLTGALASTASSPKGLDGLMGMMGQVKGTSTTDDLMKMVSGGGSNQLLSGIFGSGLSAVSGTLERALGFKVGPLIAMAAPFLIRQLSQRISSGQVTKEGLARLLQDEHATATRQGGASVKLIEQALTAGREAASTRARYSEDQWKTVRLGPVAAAGLVIGAAPSGAVGIAKEVGALSAAVARLRSNSSPASIFSLATEKEVTAQDLESLPGDRVSTLDLVKRSVAAVAVNSPVEAAGYGQFLVELVTDVANASKEGGFLGIGGTRISEDEQFVINQIKEAVEVSRAAS